MAKIINSCLFANHFPSGIFGFERYAVLISSSNLSNVSNFSIKDNVFNNLAKTFSAYYETGGVFMRNIIGGTIEGNEFVDSDDGVVSGAKDYKGIMLENCSEFVILDNSIVGTTDAYSISKTSVGIGLYESGESLVSCNTTDYLRNGIEFTGEFCDLTDLGGNKTYNHSNGLLLNNDAIIGQQINQLNQWQGIASLEGNYNFVGFDPTDPSDVYRVSLSKFEINTSNQSTVWWANPRSIGGVSDLNYWFEYNSSLPTANSYNCPIDVCCRESRMSSGDSLTLLGEFPAFQEYAASEWDASFRLFKKLDRFETLREEITGADYWYNELEDTNLGKLYDGFETIAFFPSLDEQAPLYEVGSDIENIINQIIDIDAQIETAETEEQANTYLQERNTLMDSWYELKDNYNTQLELLENIRMEQLAATLEILEGVETNTEYEENLKSVLQIQLSTELSGEDLSDMENNVIQSIASQCRYEGGVGVLLARMMLKDTVEYDDVWLCSDRNTQKPESKIERNLRVNLMPNPAADQIQIFTENGERVETVNIFNMLGELVFQSTLSDSSGTVSINTLMNGSYIVQVVFSNDEKQSLKLLIQK